MRKFVLFLLIGLGMVVSQAAINHGEVYKIEGRKFIVQKSPYTGLPIRIKPVQQQRVKGVSKDVSDLFLENNSNWMGLDPSIEDIRYAFTTHSLSGDHLHYKLFHKSREVVCSGIDVHVGWQNSVFLVQQKLPSPSCVWPERWPPFGKALQMIKEDFIMRARIHSVNKNRKGTKTNVEPIVEEQSPVYYLTRGAPVAAWQILVSSQDPFNRMIYWVGDNPLRVLSVSPLVLDIDGQGRVFYPNPVNYLDDTSLRDDSPLSAFENAYVDLTLPDLNDPGQGNPYTLSGLWVNIVSRNDEYPQIAPPAENSPVFLYDRSQDGFEAVMAYYWVDWAQNYIQSLGFDNIVHRPIEVDVHGLSGADNSHYAIGFGESQGNGHLAFGDGGVDDAEDADIILHEYGHAIQDSSNPGAFASDGQTGAIGEGFGDYWAFSNTYNLSIVHGFDPFCIGEWDSTYYSTSDPPCLRRVDTGKVYPGDMDGEVHDDGEIWSCALKNIFLQLGKEITDTLVLESHFLMPRHPSFYQGATAMLDADDEIYGGVHKYELCQEFYNRGIFSADDCKANGPFFEIKSVQINELDGNGNGIIEPGELVSANLNIKNTGSYDAQDVHASLEPMVGLRIYRNDIAFGLVGAGKDASSHVPSIIFYVDSAVQCGKTLTLNVDIEFGNHRQTVTFPLNVGSFDDTVAVQDDLESDSGLWQNGAAEGSTFSWLKKISSPYYHNGPVAWYGQDLSTVNDSYIIFGPLDLDEGFDYILSFWHTFSLEGGFDGGVIEISTDGTSWEDLGDKILENGYNNVISTEYGSPIGGRNAWSGGNLGNMRQVLVDLSQWAGDSVMIRFRLASDESTSGSGWYIDDLLLIKRMVTCSVNDFRFGDLNNDEVIDAQDLLILKEYLLGMIVPGENSFNRLPFAADMNGDMKINIVDLLILERAINN